MKLKNGFWTTNCYITVYSSLYAKCDIRFQYSNSYKHA